MQISNTEDKRTIVFDVYVYVAVCTHVQKRIGPKPNVPEKHFFFKYKNICKVFFQSNI